MKVEGGAAVRAKKKEEEMKKRGSMRDSSVSLVKHSIWFISASA